MARRDLEVRVRADVGAYQKAMSAAASSTDELGQAGLRLQKLGLSVSNLGDTLTKNVTLPLVLAGGAALKLSSDFDKSFTTMQTLAGVTAGEVGNLKESVLDLAGETGRAPQELAEALYFLQSSGLDSADAMEALEVSAKASAAGLGETQSIANAVSSAMLGYAKSGLTAAEATDVLVETARQGKAEPAELAGQMGRLIPIASELGITFGDVGGAIAALSTKGFDAEGATTALVNVMGKLLKPSEQASKLLEAVGLSTDTIRQSIAEKGLLATLEELKAKLGDAGFVKFLEDQQAVQGGLALLGGDLEATKKIFAEVNDSAGATANAFSTWAESMGAENAQAFAQFQVALIKIGDLIAPIATDILNFVAMVVGAFSSLPDPLQKAIVYFGLIAAAVGPLLSVGGRLITLFGTTVRLMSSFAVPAGSVASAFNATGTAATGAASGVGAMGFAMRALPIAAAIAGAIAYAHSLSETVIHADRLVSALASQDEALRGQAQEAIRALIAMDEFDAAVEKAAETNLAGAQRMVEYAEAAGLSGDALREVKAIINEKSEADAQAAVDQQTNTAAIDEATGALEGETGALDAATSALEEHANLLRAQFDPLFGLINAQHELAGSQVEITTAQDALNTAIAEHGPASAEAAEAQQALEDAQWAGVTAAYGLEQAQIAAAKAAAEEGLSVDEARARGYLWAAQAGLTGAAADAVAQKFADAAAAGAGYAQDYTATIGVSGAGAALTQIGAVKFAIDALPTDKNIEVNVSLTGAASGLVGQRLTFRQHGGPVHAGQAYIVGENHPELFVPNRDGMIMPTVPPMASPAPLGHSGMGGRGDIHLTVNVSSPLASAGQVGTAVVEAIQAHERSNGSGWRQ